MGTFTYSDVGIDMLSCTILKTMYRTISNSMFNDKPRSNTTRFRSGTELNLPAAQDESSYSLAYASTQYDATCEMVLEQLCAGQKSR